MSANDFCRHCGERPITRPRNLCWSCYYDPAILARYPSRVANHRGQLPGVGLLNLTPTLPEPVPYPPGSPEKVEVMEKRAMLHQHLFHPADGRRTP